MSYETKQWLENQYTDTLLGLGYSEEDNELKDGFRAVKDSLPVFNPRYTMVGPIFDYYGKTKYIISFSGRDEENPFVIQRNNVKDSDEEINTKTTLYNSGKFSFELSTVGNADKSLKLTQEVIDGKKVLKIEYKNMQYTYTEDNPTREVVAHREIEGKKIDIKVNQNPSEDLVEGYIVQYTGDNLEDEKSKFATIKGSISDNAQNLPFDNTIPEVTVDIVTSHVIGKRIGHMPIYPSSDLCRLINRYASMVVPEMSNRITGICKYLKTKGTPSKTKEKEVA